MDVAKLLLRPRRVHTDAEQMTCVASPPSPVDLILDAADVATAHRQYLTTAIWAPIVSSHHPRIVPAEISKRVPAPVKKGKARVLRKDGSPHRA